MVPNEVLEEKYILYDKEVLKCSNCGDVLEIIEDIKSINCPICNKNINWDMGGWWD